MTEYTDNYGLNKYSDGDAANLRDQYNASMDIIDTQVKTANDNASNATTILNATGLIDTETAGASKTRWDGAASLAATNESGIAEIDTNLNALGANSATDAGASKTRWDGAASQAATNKSDIADINANLNALHANSAEDATSLYEKITDTEFTELIVIGDSYAQGIGASDVSHQYAHIVANSLGLNLHNYAIGGTGFNNKGSGGNGRFDNQMATAANDGSYPHDKVKYIIVEGGTNDWGEIATAKTVTETICNLAQKNFPNARILFVLTQGVGPGSIKLYPAVKLLNYPAIQETAGNYNNADVLRGDYWFNIWNAKNYASEDYIHPNDAGHQFIASRIICALKYGDFQKIENLNQSYTQLYITVNETYEDLISNFSSIVYFIGNGLCNLTINFKYTVQADDIDPSGTFYRVNKPLLKFPDNVIINYPNISVLNYFVRKLSDNVGFQTRYGVINLFNNNNKPLVISPGTIDNLPPSTAKANDILQFNINCTMPYYGYAN